MAIRKWLDASNASCQIMQYLGCKICHVPDLYPQYELKDGCIYCRDHTLTVDKYMHDSIIQQCITQTVMKCKICFKIKKYRNINQHQTKCFGIMMYSEQYVLQKFYYNIENRSEIECSQCRQLPIQPKYCQQNKVIICLFCTFMSKNYYYTYQDIVDLPQEIMQKYQQIQIKCKIPVCNMIVSFLDAKEHFLNCDGRTKSCIYCCKEIIKKYYPLHRAGCGQRKIKVVDDYLQIRDQIFITQQDILQQKIENSKNQRKLEQCYLRLKILEEEQKEDS